MKILLSLLAAFGLTSCAASLSDISTPTATYLEMENRTFVSPSDGMIFRLTLGESLHQDTGGITDVPRGISGMRQATSSFYSIEDKNGSGYGAAESSITKEFENYIQYIKIQHEQVSGRILVTEDTSDALPSVRYILFTPTNPGYRVEYLAPDYELDPDDSSPYASPPKVILLPDDRAWVGGQTIPMSRILKSRTPFSMGG